MRLYFCSIDMYCLRFSQNYDFIFNFHHHPAKNLSSPPEEYTRDYTPVHAPLLISRPDLPHAPQKLLDVSASLPIGVIYAE